MEYTSYSPGDLSEIARDILAHSKGSRLFAFYGEMGAGKTTFILEFIKILGVTHPGSSPTFSIVNEYSDAHKKPLYHFDFYRIRSLEEVYDIGYEDYFYSGSYCFMEWPEKIEDILPHETVKIFIDVKENRRKIKLELPS